MQEPQGAQGLVYYAYQLLLCDHGYVFYYLAKVVLEVFHYQKHFKGALVLLYDEIVKLGNVV